MFIKPLKQLRYETCVNLNFIIPQIQRPEPAIFAVSKGPLERLGTMVSGNFGNNEEHKKLSEEE